MRFDLATFALQTINVTVLIAILWRLFYRPLADVIERRRAAEQARIAQTERAREQARRELDELNAARVAMENDRAKLDAQAQVDAQARARAIEAQASATRAAALEDARVEIARERKDAAAVLVEEARGVALAAASRLLSLSACTGPHASPDLPFVERLIEQVAADADRLRASWCDPTGDAVLTLATARPLAAPARERAQSALASALGVPLQLSFDEDRELIAGAELRHPHGVLSNHWAGELAAALARPASDAARDGHAARPAAVPG